MTRKIGFRFVVWVKKNEVLPGVVNVLFVLIFLVNPSDKVLFLVSFFHLVAMLMVTDSIKETFVYLFWPWFVFEAGREFIFELVPLGKILSINYSSPVVVRAVFSPFSVLGAMMTVVLMKSWWQGKIPRLAWLLMLSGYLLARLGSALLTDYSRVFSLYFVLREMWKVAWLVLALVSLRENGKKVVTNLLVTIAALWLVDIIVALMQYMKGSFLGLNAERAHYLASYGQGRDESEGKLRVSGLWYHPNGLANWLVQCSFAIYLLYTMLDPNRFRKKFTIKHIWVGFVLAVISFLTLNRIVMMTLLVSVLINWREWYGSVRGVAKWLKNDLLMRVVLVLLPVVVLMLRMKDRLLLSIYSLESGGGLGTRMLQFKEAVTMVKIAPVFGHGVGMYRAALSFWIPNGEVRYFPENVHNAFLLVASESGLVALLLGVVFLLITMMKVFNVKDVDKRLVLTWIFFSIMFMMFHPVVVDFIALSTLMALLVAEYEKKEKV